MTTAKTKGKTERRGNRRSASYDQRRKFPRFFFDLDWFVESNGCSTMGRGLEISVRGALLPVTCNSPFSSEVTLFVSLPARSRMFKARCHAKFSGEKGWVLSFNDVQPEDLQLLGSTLIGEYGLLALPNLERRYSNFETLEAARLASMR